MSKCLVTGANGFIGSALIAELFKNDETIVASTRKPLELAKKIIQVNVGELDSSTDWFPALQGVDVVIHTAARVHVMQDSSKNPLAEFRKANVDGTLRLAQQAASLGIKRFVFLSSIKVNGEISQKKPFTADDQFIPSDPYGLSKYEAEQGLLALARKTRMEVVIIRPPLVYGPKVKGNFLSMIKWVKKGIPLPFGAIYNQRSLVALDNLVHFIIHCSQHPKAANEVFLVSDCEDVSTAILIKKVAKAFNKKAFLLPIPVVFLTFIATRLNKKALASRLFGSLQIDNLKAQQLLDWKPIITMDEQLKKIATVL